MFIISIMLARKKNPQKKRTANVKTDATVQACRPFSPHSMAFLKGREEEKLMFIEKERTERRVQYMSEIFSFKKKQ